MNPRVPQTGRTPQEIEAYLKAEELRDRAAIEIMHWHRRSAGCGQYTVWADEADVAKCACSSWRPTDPKRNNQLVMILRELWDSEIAPERFLRAIVEAFAEPKENEMPRELSGYTIRAADIPVADIDARDEAQALRMWSEDYPEATHAYIDYGVIGKVRWTKTKGTWVSDLVQAVL